ncbi:PREDICTED: replication protein A 70 kDa DNA-binding subunit C-like [Camelina sativa]|uniref:Replication protein A 70 kDa DNA-binding subunit C-like n=1 Tax=Camelina sativa TaxID=90675 RepID=A0ABM0XRW2_CAMSA|nr:PREDICTED: replication protein A 70 kDa DNA-binding subunit C-like [Camelina sativa]
MEGESSRKRKELMSDFEWEDGAIEKVKQAFQKMRDVVLKETNKRFTAIRDMVKDYMKKKEEFIGLMCQLEKIDAQLSQMNDILEVHIDLVAERNMLEEVRAIVNVGNLDSVKTKGKDNVKLSFDLQDLTGTGLNCTVWGDLAKDFDTQIKEYQDTVVVCVIRFACLKEWRGNYSISNAFNSTDIMINPVMPEVDAFRNKLPTDAVDLVQLDDEPSPQKTKARTCVTIATIYYVQVLPKWYYIARKVCNKKVQPYPLESQSGNDLLYSCGVCDVDVTDVDYKYKLILHVGYGNSQKIKLLFFDGLAQLFIGKKAEELALEKSKEDIAVIPESLSFLIGKTMLFKISITIDNSKSDKSAYVVEKFWEKDDMVVQFGKELYGRHELSNNSSDTNDHKLHIAPAETSLSLCKRDHTESNVVSNGGYGK